MSKSKILLLTLAGWSIFFLIIIAGIEYHYAGEIAVTQAMQARVARFVLLFLLIWCVGALPLFIAAIVTRKEKQLSKREVEK